MKTVEKIRKLVEEECKKDSNIFGYNIWTAHIIPAVNFAKILAKKMNADLEIVEIAALLHDYAAIEGYAPNTHHISGAREAERILKELNYPKPKIEKIKHCIYAHRASQSIKRETKEAECVANADAMSHFDNIPSLFFWRLLCIK
jgi:HD superfamily phosphodiesterase